MVSGHFSGVLACVVFSAVLTALVLLLLKPAGGRRQRHRS